MLSGKGSFKYEEKMIITHHREKLINAISYFAKHTKYCGKTKLMKLLYFLDFLHFKQTGKAITGLEYFAWERGPVPKELFEELENMKPDLSSAIKITPIGDFQKVVSQKKVNDEFFTKREKGILENIALIFKEAKAEDMVEISHLKKEPWHKTLKEKGAFKKIDYILAIDTMENSLSYAEAKKRTQERSEMHKIFGTD